MLLKFDFIRKNPSDYMTQILHLSVNLELCYWKVVLIPKETLLVMVHHWGILVCLHLLLV